MAGERKVFSWVFRTTKAFVGSGIDRLWIYRRRGIGLDANMREIRLPPCPPEEDEGLPGRVARYKVPIVCQNVSTDPGFGRLYRPVFSDAQAQWCFPMFVPECTLETHTPAVLCLESTSPSGIDPALKPRIELVIQIAGLKLAGLWGARRLERVAIEQDDVERWKLEKQISELSGIQPEPAIRRLFDLLAEVLKPQGVSLWQYDETEDNLCHPIFSSRSPREYRDYPRPGPWGSIGRVLKDGSPLFFPDIQKAPQELRESRFMRELAVRSTAYLPAGRSSSASTDATRARGILFVNYPDEHRFDRLEKELLQWAADSAVESLQLRSLTRRYRLAQHFNLGEDPAYPDSASVPRAAARAVLTAFVPQLGYQLGVLYVRDRPGSVYVRYESTGTAGDKYRGRYLESNPLVVRLADLETHTVLNGPDLELLGTGQSRKGQSLVLPLRRNDDLLGFALFSRPDELQVAEVSPNLVALCGEALKTLLDLDHRVRSKRRQVSLLAQFLRIYEYASRESSPVPLLNAYLDALLEGSTADACSIYLEKRQAWSRQRVVRGDVRRFSTEELPLVLRKVLETGEPSFENFPEHVAPEQPDVRAQILLPLRFQDHTFGVLCVEYHVEHNFSEEDRWFFPVLAHQLGQTLHFLEGNQILLKRVSSLALSGARIAQLGSPEFGEAVPVFEESRKLALLAKEYSRADFVDLWVLLKGNQFMLQATNGGTEDNRVGHVTWEPHQGLGALVFRSKVHILMEDVTSERSRRLGYVPTPAFPDAYSELIVPVVDDDRVIAVIDLNSRRPGAFNEGDASFVQAIAAQAVALGRATELQNARRQLREERDLLVRINTIAQEATGQGQTVVLDRILRELGKYVKVEFLSIHLLGRDGYTFDPDLSVANPPPPDLLRGLNLDNSILGRAVKELRADPGKEQLLIEDVVHPPPGYPPTRRPTPEPKMAELVIPLGLGPEIVGVINLEHPDAGLLQSHLDLIKAVVKGIRNALALADDASRRVGGELRQRMAEEADEFLQLLISTVFHDAPQLVQGLKLQLDALEKAFRSDGAGSGGSELARAFARRQGEFQAGLDRLGRLSSVLPSYGQPALLQPDRVDVIEIVRRTFAKEALQALPYYKAVRCQVRLSVPEEPLYVLESTNWVRNILENLAINAFRAMDEKKTRDPALTVSAESRDEGRLVLVRVEDNGPGIPVEIAARIGRERIAQEDRRERLGIFHRLARKHAQRYGGDLELVRNEPGRGCTFELRYPSYFEPDALVARGVYAS
jgi:GAF domain-containing protein